MFYMQLNKQSEIFQQNFNNAHDFHKHQHKTRATTSGNSNKNHKTNPKTTRKSVKTKKSLTSSSLLESKKNFNEMFQSASLTSFATLPSTSTSSTSMDSPFDDITTSSTQSSVVSRYAPQTYDAVWAIALSLRGAEERWRKDAMQQSKLDRFDYTRSDMASEFLQQMGKLDFLGVSVSQNLVPVQF